MFKNSNERGGGGGSLLGVDVFNIRHGILRYRKMLVVFLSIICSKNCPEFQSVVIIESLGSLKYTMG